MQPAAIVNDPDADVPYTRTTEFRRMTGQSATAPPRWPSSIRAPRATRTTRSRSDETRALYKRYEALAAELPDVTFVGRLARYQYLNMDQVVGQALATYERMLERGVAAHIALPSAG